jgi:hypothetical protein
MENFYRDEETERLEELAATVAERLAARKAERKQSQEPLRTWSYYENLRKNDRWKYADPKTQVQMLKDRMELGAVFEDGNFDPRLGGVT